MGVDPKPRYTVTSLVGAGLRTYLAGRIRLLSDARHWQRNTAGIQRSQLRQLLRQASKTEFGRKHGFERLAALPTEEIVEKYREAVPIRDWYGFKDEIARMREGAEPDVLWPGLVRDFAQTSGTTAGDKYIPVSEAMLKSNFRASLDIFSHLSRFGVSLATMLAGRCLFLGGSTKLDTSDKGIKTGDLSGIVTPLIKWPISEIYLPGKEIALMSHWPSKIEAMAKRCLNEDLRMISGMPSWALVVFEKAMELARAQGRKAETVRDLWPNLMVFVHGGVKYGPFDPRMRQIWSGSPTGEDIPFRHELYPASEGFVAMQDTRHDPGLRLMSDIGNFYEFVPLEDVGTPSARGYMCDEVEKGQRYVVCMSTCAGMWRYILGDVVEFDAVPDRLPSLAKSASGSGGGDGPCRLRIVGRHRHFINAFGENLIVEHVENAVAQAATATELVVGEFTAAPVYPRAQVRAGLELVVEVASSAVEPGRLKAFGERFDAALKAQNADYTTKRTDSLGMAEPTITPVAMGTFHRWMESRGKLGGQHKCPRCANGRDHIDQVRTFAGLPALGGQG
jgi:hypothetical protein